eukprot:gene8945-12062_t
MSNFEETNGNYDEDINISLTEEDVSFYLSWMIHKQLTLEFPDIENYIISVWKQVKQSFHTYRCIQSLSFLEPKVHKFSIYQHMINDFTENPESFCVADIGCCFGQDIRKMILDGIESRKIHAIDIHDGYWNAGKILYKDIDEDSDDNTLNYISDNHIISTKSMLNGVNELFCDMASSTSYYTIESLHNSFDYILCQSVFHVLSYNQSCNLIQKINNILKPGGTVFGSCVGGKTACEWAFTPNGQEKRFLHSVESLQSLFVQFNFIDIKIYESARGNMKLRYSTDKQEEWSNKTRLEFSARKL